VLLISHSFTWYYPITHSFLQDFIFVTAVVIQGPDNIVNDRPAFRVKVRGARIASGMADSIFLNQQGADLSLEQIQVTGVTASMFVLVDNRFATNADTQTNISETDVSNSSLDVSTVHAGNMKCMRQLVSLCAFVFVCLIVYISSLCSY
jgi:hypothetical protein